MHCILLLDSGKRKCYCSRRLLIGQVNSSSGVGGEGLWDVMEVYLASHGEIVLSFEKYVHNIATVGQQERVNYLS